MPVVSVIIPTYNHAMYIERTLESVFQQTYKNYEIIVIDDGSTDNTQEVIKSYENKITYICKENEGTAKSRNLGLKIAKGRYVAFLDSDDLWMPQKLELQVTLLDKNIDIGLVCTDFEIFCENEEGIKIIEKRVETSFDFSFNRLFSGNFVQNSSVMVRRECFDKVGLFDEVFPIAKDYDMWLRIRRFYEFGHIPQILARYRIHQGNVLGIDPEKGFSWYLTTTETFLQKFPSIAHEYGIDKNQYFNDVYFKCGVKNYQDRQYKMAVKRFAKSLAYKPFCWKSFSYCCSSMLKASIQRFS